MVKNIVYDDFRKETYIKSIKVRNEPQKFCFWDIETETQAGVFDETLPFRLGVLKYVVLHTDGNMYLIERYVVRSVEDLVKKIQGLANSYHTVKFIAHNTGFDLQHGLVLESLLGMGWEIRTYYQKLTTTVIKLRRGQQHITFLDSMNLSLIHI